MNQDGELSGDKKRSMKQLFTAIVLSLGLAQASTAQSADSMPAGWRRVGPPEALPLYQVGFDADVKHEGSSSLRVRYIAQQPSEFGTVVSHSFRADEYRGRRVRLAGYTRSDNATGLGRLWFRVDGSATGTPFDNMSDRPVKGTTGWQRHELVLDVPVDATVIHIGAIFTGQGTLWLDDFAFTIVDAAIAVTGTVREEQNRNAAAADLPSKPLGLAFERPAR